MTKGTEVNLSILVVEDNDTMREGMVQILRKAGHKVREASGGREGLSQLEKKGVELVITDYRMVEMDGLQLLKKIKFHFSLRRIASLNPSYIVHQGN